MNKIALSFLVATALTTHAQSVSRTDVIHNYTARAFAKYSEAVVTAQKLQQAVEILLKDPTENNLRLAREAWVAARLPYSETETYRFYAGPIDGETGPEGFINSWPLDELYIDSIVERADLYPQINESSIRGANEKDGHKNISTGYHAIEFMLWGPDTFVDSAGRRPASDFDSSKSPTATRRASYLRTLTAVLIKDLQSVQNAWDLKTPNSYAQNFQRKSQELSAIKDMFVGMIKLAGAELSQERMFVALDTKSQEEEQSCFSDTTHNDILHNFLGIKNVMNDGLLDLIRLRDVSVADEIEFNLAEAEEAIRKIPAPFDQAILKDPGRRLVMNAINRLEDLAESLKQGAVTVGVEIP
jgi:putative iron-regulated protein